MYSCALPATEAIGGMMLSVMDLSIASDGADWPIQESFR
jgi:hypothetical protein